MGGLQTSLNLQYIIINISPLAILQSCPDQKPSQAETVMWWSCAKSLLNGLSVLHAFPTLIEVLVSDSHIIIESQNHEGWKRPLRSSSPTMNPTPPCLLNHVPKGHIYMGFEPLQGWGLHHCPGQPGPRPDHSFL